jgi:DNA-binding winged helix-turn-helix (wHTH) protein
MGVSSQSRSFAGFSFDPVTGQLTRDGRLVPLEYQPSVVLSRLLQAPGSLVTRQELAETVWGTGTHVNYDDGLNYCVRQIRAALGDDPRRPRFIETIPRRGYRFIAPVTELSAPAWRSRRSLVPAVGVAMLLVAVMVMESRPNNHHETAVDVARMLHGLIF